MIHLRRRNVRFNDEIQSVEPEERRNEEETRASWLQQEDFERMRKETIHASEVVWRSQAKHAENPLTYTNVFSRVYQSCQFQIGPGDVDLKQLAYWMELQPHRRGLERQLLTDMSVARAERIRSHRLAILRLQGCTRLPGIKQEDATAILHTRSSQMTKPEAMYAQALAKADEIARVESDRREDQQRRKQEHERVRQEQAKSVVMQSAMTNMPETSELDESKSNSNKARANHNPLAKQSNRKPLLFHIFKLHKADRSS